MSISTETKPKTSKKREVKIVAGDRKWAVSTLESQGVFVRNIEPVHSSGTFINSNKEKWPL